MIIFAINSILLYFASITIYLQTKYLRAVYLRAKSQGAHITMTNPQTDFIFQPFKVIKVDYKGNQIPRPRSGHRIVCDDENVYCFGGYNPSPALPVMNPPDPIPTWTHDRPLFRELWSFNIASRRWKPHRVIEGMPEELASNAMCMNINILMIHGGTGNPFGDKCSNDVIVWKTGPGDAKLKKLEVTGTSPPGQYGQAILGDKEYFYTVGGTNGYAYNCDIYRLDLRTMQWEAMFMGTGQENEPFGRYRHEVIRMDRKLYIVGGGTGEWAFELMEIPSFDLHTRQWQILTPKPDDDDSTKGPLVPLPRKCHSAVQIDTPNGVQVFVTGGTDGQSVFDDVWRLDIPSLKWTLMKETLLPYPLYFHSSAVTSTGCMYVFGGIEPKERSACRNNVMLKCWVCIPKLSEICWEAMLHFHPYLDHIDRTTLLDIGIPMHLVTRLHPK